MGTGRFVGPKTIEAELNEGGTRTFRGKNVVINTGSRATLESIPGLAEVQPLIHIEALELDHFSEALLILGAGYSSHDDGRPYSAIPDRFRQGFLFRNSCHLSETTKRLVDLLLGL